ncbi:MAG: von Willebrand factor type A domain-containing protein [Verrucomicrobiota bacterium]
MDQEPPTPFDTVGDEPVEARIVAWVLGEASTFEAAELERLCEERPELLVFRRRMRALHGLLTEAEASEAEHSWKLPPEKRKLLDEICGPTHSLTEFETEKRISRSAIRALQAIAACLFLTLFISIFFAAGSASIQKAKRASRSEKTVDFMPTSGGGGQAANELQVLDKAVRDQEDKVEERRKALSTIVRTKGIIYKGQDSFYGQSGVDEDQAARVAENDTNGEAIKRGLDAQDYVDAKRDFEADQQLLQEMKLKQIELGIQTKSQDESLAMSDAPRQTPAAAKPASPSAPVASTAKRNDKAAKEMTMSLAKAKEGFKEEQQDRKRARLTATAKAEQPAPEMESKLPELAESSKIESQPKQPATGWSGSASAGGAMGLGGEKKDLGSAADSLADAQQPSAGERDVAGTVLGGSVTNGLRSGDQAVNRNNIDAILNNPNRTADGLFMDLPAAASQFERKAPVDAPAESMSTLADNESTVTSAKPRAVPPPSSMSAMGSISSGGLDAFATAAKDKDGESNSVPAQNVDLAKRFEGGGGLASGENEKHSTGKAQDMGLRAGTELSLNGELSEEIDSFAEPSGYLFKGSDLGGLAQREVIRRADAVSESDRLLSDARDDSSKGDYQGAYKKYESALDMLPDAPLVKERRDALKTRLGDTAVALALEAEKESKPEDSKNWFSKALEWNPANEQARQTLVLDTVNEIPASENPYSTFSLNISDASFQLAKAALAKGERPDPASIKPEQFYNAVDYGDPAPASNEPVAATVEQSAHPIIPGRNLVRVALRTGSVGRSAVQPLRLTLLVDQSGSMVREDRRASMEHALSQLGVLLTKADLVTVIGFSRTPHILAEILTGDQSAKLSGLVNQTASEGGTNLEEAMKLAGEKALEHQLAGAQNRIVLFTDGAANLGDADPERLSEQVKAFRQKGLAFDIAGIGADGLNDRLLSELARKGNGRYYVVGSEKNDSFAKQLAGAFRPAAENVKVQVNFNPQRVGRYKLIGFEKDRLKTEDFRNDAVDAAELAADEAGVAIYQVEPIAGGTGEIGEVSVRFRDAASQEMVERTWTIPHDTQATAFDRATPSMQLAGLSLLAAEKLKGGPMGDAIDFKLLAEPAASVKQFYGASARVGEMLQVIEKLK